MRLEKLGEQNATKIYRKYHLGYNTRATHVPHHKPMLLIQCVFQKHAGVSLMLLLILLKDLRSK